MYNTFFIHLSAATLRWLLYFCYYTFTAVIMDPWIYCSSFWCGPSALLNLLIRKTNSYSTLYSKFLAVSDTWERLGKYLEEFLYICTENNMFPTKGNTYSFLKSGSVGIWRGTWNKKNRKLILCFAKLSSHSPNHNDVTTFMNSLIRSGLLSPAWRKFSCQIENYSYVPEFPPHPGL